MPSRHEADLDWLYGRERERPEPEPTRVMPAPQDRGPQRAPETPRASLGAPPAPSAPPQTPPGYPPVPAYGEGVPRRDPGFPPQGPAGPVRPGGDGGSRPPRRRRPVRTALRTLLVLVLLLVVWLVGVPAYAWSQVGRVDDTPSGRRPGEQPGETFLLVGSDSREGLSKAQQKKLGTGDVGGQRTDTIMLVYAPPTGKPVLVSLPRDSYVTIPGHGKNKINAAFAIGGPELLVQTVEQATGLRVDGYAEVGFGGFVGVIDALDGIRMCIPSAIKDRDSHLDLEKGCQTLDGTTALGYVRMRKADPRGDLGRVERQRAMLSAVAAKAASPATQLNPVRYWQLSTATASAIKVGDDTTVVDTARAGLALRTVSAGDGFTLTVPVSDPGFASPVGSAVLWDASAADDLFSQIARGDTSKLGRFAK
ncbi:LCP family protein [Microlunatus flavus]|nr:LCP family protein [Microlunatus flavus]